MRTIALIAVALTVACSGGGDGSDGPATEDTAVVDTETTQSGTCCHTVLPLFEVDKVDHEGLPALWVVPEDPVGALVVFHGSDGNLETIQQVEWLEIYNLLYERGIAIIATVSSDRDEKQWDTTAIPDNVDYPRVQSLLQRVADESSFTMDLPLVTLGFSQGCSMADQMGDLGRAQGENVVGVVLHNCQRLGPGDLPTLFVDAEHDWQADDMAAAADAHPLGTLIEGHELPLHPYRFAKFDYFSQDDSQQVFDELVRQGIVDEDGERVIDLGEDPEAVAMQLEQQLTMRGSGDVVQQLRVVWSMHRLSAENKVAEAAWIADRM